jgi:hypothetical protein
MPNWVGERLLKVVALDTSLPRQFEDFDQSKMISDRTIRWPLID